jgi:hypothetical protein
VELAIDILIGAAIVAGCVAALLMVSVLAGTALFLVRTARDGRREGPQGEVLVRDFRSLRTVAVTLGPDGRVESVRYPCGIDDHGHQTASGADFCMAMRQGAGEEALRR